MSSPKQIAHLDETTRRLDRVIDAVVERGYENKSEAIDDYGILLASFEHRKLVTFQLYDSYFPPKRHEFELQLVTSFVDAVVATPVAIFVGSAVAGGILGNAAYDVLKHLLARLSNKTKPIKRTHDSFMEIKENADRITLFFKRRRQANIIDICKVLGTEPGKIEPLLKLLGFRCRRVGTRRIWIAPVHQKTPRTSKVK